MARTQRHERIATLTQADGRSWTFSTQCSSPEQDAYYTLYDIPGWFGGAGVKAHVTERSRHSAFEMRGYREGRTMSLVGGVIALTQEACDLAQRELSSMMWSGEIGTLRVEESERITLNSRVRLDGAPKIERLDLTHLEFTIPLYSPEAFLYADARSAYSFPSHTGRGLVYPLFSGYLPPPTPPVDHSISADKTFTDLTDLFSTGAITTDGGSTVEVSTDWAADGTTSLKINPGTSNASAAYILPRYSAFGDWAGRLVTAEATVHLPQAMPDGSSSSPNRRASIIVGADYADGSDPIMDYASAPSPGPAAGTYPVKVQCLLPDDLTTYQGWFIRLLNGSQEVPVYWDAFKVTGQEVPRIVVGGSTPLGTPTYAPVPSFDVDQGTGEIYAVQQRDSSDEVIRENIARNALFTSLRGCFGVGQFVPGSSAALSVSSEWASEGRTSLKIAPTTNVNGGAYLMPTSGVEVMGQSIASGTSVTVGLDMYIPAVQEAPFSSQVRTFAIGFVTESGSVSIPSANWAESAPNTVGVHRITKTVVVPSGMAGVFVYVRAGSTSTPVYVDRMTVELGATDGSWIPSLYGDDDPLERVNMISNGGFEDGIDQSSESKMGKSGNTDQVVLDTAWKASGAQSIRIDPKGTGNGDSSAYVLGSSSATVLATYGFVPGNVYTVSGTLRLAAAQTGSLSSAARSIRINTYDGTTTTYGWALSPQAPNAAGVYRLSVTFTVPESSATGGLTVTLYNGSSGTPAWWDDVVVEPGETSGAKLTTSGVRNTRRGLTRTPTDIARNGGTALLGTVLGRSSVISTTGGATATLDTEWAPTSGGRSIKISGGTSVASGIYLSHPNMPTSLHAGDLVTVTCKMRLASAQTDNPVSDGNHLPRSIVLSARRTAGSDSDVRWAMNWSAPAPNAAGVHDLSATFLVPDGFTSYVEWAIRIVNGSTSTPVWVGDVHVTAQQTNRIEPVGAAWPVSVPGDRVVQGVDIDQVTGEIYVTQRSATSDDDLRVHRLSPAGAVLETMYLPGGGHGGDIAIEHASDGTVWYWNQWPAAGGRVRVRFRSGTVNPGDADIQYLWSTSYARYSIWNGLVTVRSSTTNAAGVGVARYTQFNLEEYKAGGAVAVRYLQMEDRTPYGFQGFFATDEYIYEAGGGDKGDVPAVYRYSWTSPKSRRVLRSSGFGVDASGYAEAEGITMDPATGNILVGIASGNPGSRIENLFPVGPEQWDAVPMFEKAGATVSEAGEDVHVHKLSAEGNLMGSMTLIGGGPTGELAVEHSDGEAWIWSRWDSHPDRGARIRWREGGVQWDDADVLGAPISGAESIDYAVHGDEVAVRAQGAYQVYDLEAFKAGDRTVKRQLSGLDEVVHEYRGFTFDSRYLYVHHGGSKGDNTGIWRYSWTGSDKADPAVMRTSGNWYTGGSRRNEAAGVAMRESTGDLLVGVMGGPVGSSVTAIQEADPAQFDYREEWEDPGDGQGEETTAGGVLTYGEELQDPQATITNGGLVDAPLVARTYGDFPGGVTVTSSLGTGSLTFPWPITEEVPLELYGEGEAWMGDTNVSYLLTNRDFSQLIVAPGETRSIYFNPLQGGSGYLQVDINEKYA